eukprot:gene16696-19040_t
MITMDILLSLPEEFLRYILLNWLDLATIARLDSAYASHHSRTKFLSHIYNASFVHDGYVVLSLDDPVTKQVKLVQWLVRRECRVRRVCLSVDSRQCEELMTEFFRISGSSLHNIEIQNKSSDTAGDILWRLLLEHCHNLQRFCIKEHFPEYPDFLRELSLRCPCINYLELSLSNEHTIAYSPGLRFSQLRYLQLTETGSSGLLLAVIAPGSPRLETLLLERAIDIDAEHFTAIAEHCPLLHTVSLNDLFIGDVELQPLVTGCKNLRTLEVTIPSWDDLTDLSLLHIAQNCLLLSLRGRFSYSSECLSAVAQSCTKLQQVCISTGRRHLKTSLPDVFESHVEVVVTVERGVKYQKEVSDEEHANRGMNLGIIGAGDY